MFETSQCQVCKSKKLRPVLNLGDHPLCDDLIRVGSPETCNEYPISVLLCEDCLTANQQTNVRKEVLFTENYHYRARQTADVLNGMAAMVLETKEHVGDLTGKKVMDVGCNDGSLLSIFAVHGAQTFGVEPTGAHKDISSEHSVWGGYYTVDLAREIAVSVGKMDIICFTNVFAHIENFDDLISGGRELCHPKTKILIENHFLGSVIDRNQFDTFYHEHPRTYSVKSFRSVAEQLGMHIEHLSFPKRYGGNIRVILGSDRAMQSLEPFQSAEKGYLEKFKDMAAFVEKWKVEKRAEIEALNAQHGALTAKAFPGRAAILIKLLNLDVSHIKRISEKPGSMKIGHYAPGTRIPIVSDNEISYDQEDCILNLAWHISDEISGYIKGQGFTGTLVNIL